MPLFRLAFQLCVHVGCLFNGGIPYDLWIDCPVRPSNASTQNKDLKMNPMSANASDMYFQMNAYPSQLPSKSQESQHYSFPNAWSFLAVSPFCIVCTCVQGFSPPPPPPNCHPSPVLCRETMRLEFCILLLEAKAIIGCFSLESHCDQKAIYKSEYIQNKPQGESICCRRMLCHGKLLHL